VADGDAVGCICVLLAGPEPIQCGNGEPSPIPVAVDHMLERSALTSWVPPDPAGFGKFRGDDLHLILTHGKYPGAQMFVAQQEHGWVRN
jgi:hypothetical protein